MVLRLVAEEVTWTNDGSTSAEAQQWRREMLASLTGGLDTVLPFLTRALEANYASAIAASQAGDTALSRTHAAAVAAGLGVSHVQMLQRALHNISDKRVQREESMLTAMELVVADSL